MKRIKKIADFAISAFLLTALTSPAFAAKVKKIYTVSGEGVAFEFKQGAYVTAGCAKNCSALRKLQNFKKRLKARGGALPKSSPSKYAKSSASIACESMGGKSVFGVDSSKNMMALCRFEDGSMIEYSSLEELFGESP